MMRRMAVGAVGLMLALSACEMGLDLVVEHDGSGTFGFSFGIEEALASQIPGGEDPFAGFREQFGAGPVEWSFEEYSERGLRGIRATIPFSSIADLESNMAALDESPDGSGGGFGDEFRLEQTATGWVLHATGEAPSSSFGGLDAPPSDVPPGFEQSLDPSSLAGVLDISMRVTLPGTAVSTDATETIPAGNSTTFVWTLDPSSTAPVSMRAETEVGAGGGIPLIPVGAGVVLLGLGLIAAARLRRPSTSLPPEPVLEGFTPRAREDDSDSEVAV